MQLEHSDGHSNTQTKMSKLTGGAVGAGGNAGGGSNGTSPVKRTADQMMNNGNNASNKTSTGNAAKRTTDMSNGKVVIQQAAKRASVDNGSGNFRFILL